MRSSVVTGARKTQKMESKRIRRLASAEIVQNKQAKTTGVGRYVPPKPRWLTQ
jgi:hypothetical protein